MRISLRVLLSKKLPAAPPRARRPITAAATVAALVIAQFAYLMLTAPASQAVPGAGANFDCFGGTIYTIQRASSGGGVIYGLDSSTFGSGTVSATAVTTVPGETSPNALAITQGGGHAYTVHQSTGAGATTVALYGYDANTSTWNTYTGSAPQNANFVAGALDPFNQIYYYATYDATSGTATIFGFDTTNNTAITGAVATVTLPIPAGGSGGNGDIAFDQGGNLYLVESVGTNAAVGVVKGPLPTTGNNASLSSVVLANYSDPNSYGYNGIAFDNYGRLFIQYTNGSDTSYLLELDPNTGTVIHAQTTEGAAGSQLTVDLAACSLNPTLTTNIDVVGRSHPTDQFTMTITGDVPSGQGYTGTTTGNSNGMQPQTAGPIIGVSGDHYTIDETAAGTTNWAHYEVSYSCLDAAAGNRVVWSGLGRTIDLNPFPDPAGGSTGPYVTCTFTNTPTPASLDTVKTVTKVNGSAATQTTPVTGGNSITYKDSVTNTGGSSGTTTLTETIPANATYTGSGEGWTCSGGTAAGDTCTQAVTAAPDAAPNVSFTITLDNPLPQGTTSVSDTVASSAGTCSSCTASNPVAAVLDSALTLTQVNGSAADTSTIIRPGDLLEYTVTVTNIGGSSAATTISDHVPSSTKYVGGGEGWSCATNAPAGTNCTQSVTAAAYAQTSVTFTVRALSPFSPTITHLTDSITSTTDSCSSCDVANATAVLDTTTTIDTVDGSPATTSTPIAAGQAVVYDVTVTNMGGAADTTTLTETIPIGTNYTGSGEGWTCSGGTAAGDTCTQNVSAGGSPVGTTFTVTAANPIPQGQQTVENTLASSNGTCSSCDVSNPTAAVLDTTHTVVQVNGQPADSTTPVAPGDTITYADTVMNTGGSSGTTTITETIGAHLAYNVGGEGWTCLGGTEAGDTCTQDVTVGASGNRTVDITETVDNPLQSGVVQITTTATTSNGTCSQCTAINPTVAELVTSTDVTTVAGSPATTATPIGSGDIVVYTVTVDNRGGTTDTTTVTETIPAGTTYTGSAEGWTCVDTTAGNTCTQDVTATGNDSTAVTFTVTASDPLPTNQQTVDDETSTSVGSCVGCSVVNRTAALLDTTLVPLSVNGGTGNTDVGAGDVIVYGITVTNIGGTGGATTLTETVPDNTTYTGSAEGWTCGGTTAGSTCTQDASVLANDQSAYQFTVTVDTPLPAGTTGILDRVTTSTGTCSSCGVSNPTSGVLNTAVDLDTVNGTTAGQDAHIKGGDVLTYTITVTNTGATMTSTTLTDTVPKHTTYTGTNEGWTCPGGSVAPGTACTQTVTVAGGAQTVLPFTVTVDPDAGAAASSIVDTVTTSDGSCTDCQVPTPMQRSDLVVTKTADQASVSIGDRVTFTVTVVNNGPSDASNVVVHDHPSGLDIVSAVPSAGTFDEATGTWIVGALANGAQATLQATYTVTSATPRNTASAGNVTQYDPTAANGFSAVKLTKTAISSAPTGSGSLADTGVPVSRLLVSAALLLLLGFGLTVGFRPRRREDT